jgi:hypothetical protein
LEFVMNKYVSRGLTGALFVGGIWALGTTAAHAAPATTGDDGLLSGTQIGAVVDVPVSALGNDGCGGACCSGSGSGSGTCSGTGTGTRTGTGTGTCHDDQR